MASVAEKCVLLLALCAPAEALALSRRQLGPATAAAIAAVGAPAVAEEKASFRRLNPIQFIAALGDPASTSGGGAQDWGLWREDPGPRGVRLQGYDNLKSRGGKAQAGWQFDDKDWWLEEHGLIMEQPAALPAGRYVVTGDRAVKTILTVAADGKWSLKDGTLYDVTHLPCRSARYTGGGACSPNAAVRSDFPVTPGAVMPAVPGCAKQDYAVLFVLGVENKA